VRGVMLGAAFRRRRWWGVGAARAGLLVAALS